MVRKKTHSDFLRQVEEQGEGEYELLSQYIGSDSHVKIKHISCGNIYNVTPSNFLKGRRCPKCASIKRGHLQRYDPNKFQQEVSEVEGYSLLSQYTISTEKVKIKHDYCAKTYEVKPFDFLSGKRCPHCKGRTIGEKLKKSQETFEKEVTEITNGEYVVIGEYSTARTHIKIKHNSCGNVYNVAPTHFLRGDRCAKCTFSKGEFTIAEFLERFDIPYEKEKSFADCVYKKALKFDFAIYKRDSLACLVEYDGEQHFRAVEHFGGERALIKTQRRDHIKSRYCADNGIPLIRISYWEYDNIDAILTEKLIPILTENHAS